MIVMYTQFPTPSWSLPPWHELTTKPWNRSRLTLCVVVYPGTEPQKAEKPVQPAKPEKTVPKPAAEETKTNPPIEGNWIMDQSKHDSNCSLLWSLVTQCPLPCNAPSPPIQKERHTTETFCCSSRTSVRMPHRNCWKPDVTDLPTLSPLCKSVLFIWKREKARCQAVLYEPHPNNLAISTWVALVSGLAQFSVTCSME